MIKELHADVRETVLLLGLLANDVERLRAGESLTFALAEVSLGEGSLTVALGPKSAADEAPGGETRARLSLTEGMIEWMLTTTPMSSKFGEVGLPGAGRIVVFHSKTDAETLDAIRDYAARLARSFVPDQSVVTTYRLDRASGKVTVARFERASADKPAARASRAGTPPNVVPTLACALGTFGAISGAMTQRDPFSRGLLVLIAVVLTLVTVWSAKQLLQSRRSRERS